MPMLPISFILSLAMCVCVCAFCARFLASKTCNKNITAEYLYFVSKCEWILFAIISYSHSSHTRIRAICVWVVDTGINMKIKSFYGIAFFHRRTLDFYVLGNELLLFQICTRINKKKSGGVEYCIFRYTYECVYYFVVHTYMKAHINFLPNFLQFSCVFVLAY